MLSDLFLDVMSQTGRNVMDLLFPAWWLELLEEAISTSSVLMRATYTGYSLYNEGFCHLMNEQEFFFE